jgi:hypothetical protein
MPHPEIERSQPRKAREVRTMDLNDEPTAFPADVGSGARLAVAAATE